MSASKKDVGELWTDLEEGLRAVKGAAAVLLRIGEMPGEDSPIFSFLGDELSDKYGIAQEAFERLHDLMAKRPTP